MAISADRKAQKGLVYAFPKADPLVDGTRMKTFRTENREKQSTQYCGHHHFHYFKLLLWNDVFGLIIRLDMTMSGSEHDHDQTVYVPTKFL